MKFEIKPRFSRSILFSLETESLKLCVEAAVKSKTDLYGANLYGANLYGADLRDADLRDADLRDADLRDADLRDADLRGADLHSADLRGADLHSAKIKYGETELLLVGERPVIQLGPMGSREDYLVAMLTDDGVYVCAGCFFDTLEAFRAAVISEHGDNVHAQEYGLAIQMIELHAKLWAHATNS
jgi:hypothetical protein